MAKLVITKSTTDKTGGAVSANAIIGFDTIFIWDTFDVHYDLKVFRSQSDYDSAKTKKQLDQAKLYLNEIPDYGIVKTMTIDEYAAMLANGALVVVWLKNALIATGNFVDADLDIVP